MSSTLGDIKIYTTYPHSCSYLEEEEAVTLFIDPQTEIDNNIYSHLSHLGFRRSGPYLYRPNCQSCQACIPTRIPAPRFQPSRSQKRCLSRNRDLDWIEVDSIDTDHHYALYSRYIEHRHADGDMYPPKRDQYQSFQIGRAHV